MTAISKAFVVIADTAVDPDSPIDAQLVTGMRDNLVHLREWLGAAYTAGAAQNHSHDGVNSALVPVGPNLLRNGSFEDGTSGWTVTQFTGGTVAISTTNPLNGEKSLAFTSTVLANGGGAATSDEYLPVTSGQEYFLNATLRTSVVNLSEKMEIFWYDAAKAQISASVVHTSNANYYDIFPIGMSVIAPATARWMRCKITGCIPATGTAVGTVYFDGIVCGVGAGNVAVAGGYSSPGVAVGGSTASTTAVKLGEKRIRRGGSYTASMDLKTSLQDTSVFGQIYVNGQAIGTLRSTWSTIGANFQEVFFVSPGDLLQLYGYKSGSATCIGSFSLLEAAPE